MMARIRCPNFRAVTGRGNSCVPTHPRSFFSSLRREEISDESSDIPKYAEALLEEYGQKTPTPASLQMLMKSCTGELLGKAQQAEAFMGRMGQRLAAQRIRMQVAQYLHHELPIRLAHRIQDLDEVPLMRDMEAVKDVKRIYIDSFLEMTSFPGIRTPDDEESFAGMLNQLYLKHANVLIQMALGAYQLRDAIQSETIRGLTRKDHKVIDFERMGECHQFLDRFYMSRIGIRVLAGQYLALRDPNPLPDYVGLICQRTSPSEVVRLAADNATLMCQRQYGRAPEVLLTGRLDLTFPYIPTHLHYIVLELLKNALRATVEKHTTSETLPPVTVIIADGTENEDVVIKIADEGGGIKRSEIDKIWSYLFTTADPGVQAAMLAAQDHRLATEDHSTASPLAGFGYGLPISRSYARYFGGDIDLMSLEGYGTDAFVHLKRLGDSTEPVPV